MPAPKGNKFSVGNNGGRPPLFMNKEELIEKIAEYFESGHNTKTIIIGKAPNNYEVEVPVLTISGLAMFLGFCSRQSLYDYEQNEEFSYIIKRARLFVEMEYEEQLQHGNTTGAIFALKNMGWKDRVETENTNTNTNTDKVTVVFE